MQIVSALITTFDILKINGFLFTIIKFFIIDNAFELKRSDENVGHFVIGLVQVA